MWNYSDRMLEHFRNPRNVGVIEEADGVGEVGSLACGDALKFTFRLGADGRIADARFQTFGCASAIASSSALTEIVKGMTLDEAAKVTNQDIADYLGGLPEQKMHCSVMGREALEAAIANYRKTGAAPESDAGSEVICNCFGVARRDIERAIRENGLKSVEEVTHYTKAGGGCGMCHGDIETILRELNRNRTDGAMKLTHLQLIRRIEETIERDIRPRLRQDGGDIELVDVLGNRVSVALRGLCSNCPTASVTLKEVVENTLREYVSSDLTVEEVQ